MVDEIVIVHCTVHTLLATKYDASNLFNLRKSIQISNCIAMNICMWNKPKEDNGKWKEKTFLFLFSFRWKMFRKIFLFASF